MTAELIPENPAPPRKPRIALMGEFSAGKSTLANLLMCDTHSQVQVTVTQMPPVWYAQGEGRAVRIAMDGSEEPLDSVPVDTISIRNTRAIRKFVLADILEVCDIIDMPGSADPNITEDIWQSMLPLADAVLWCTPATQAWRQSEAAMWEEVPEHLFPRSLLLITRIDKVLSDADRRRLISRVQGEAGQMFREVIPVSLVDVQGIDDDPEIWRASGLEAVLAGLQDIIADLEAALAAQPQIAPFDLFAAGAGVADGIAENAEVEAPPPNRPAPVETSTQRADPAASELNATVSPEVAETPTSWVIPRRVVLSAEGDGKSRRPRRAVSGSLI